MDIFEDLQTQEFFQAVGDHVLGEHGVAGESMAFNGYEEGHMGVAIRVPLLPANVEAFTLSQELFPAKSCLPHPLLEDLPDLCIAEGLMYPAVNTYARIVADFCLEGKRDGTWEISDNCFDNATKLVDLARNEPDKALAVIENMRENMAPATADLLAQVLFEESDGTGIWDDDRLRIEIYTLLRDDHVILAINYMADGGGMGQVKEMDLGPRDDVEIWMLRDALVSAYPFFGDLPLPGQKPAENMN